MAVDAQRIGEIRRRHADGPFDECETCDVLAALDAALAAAPGDKSNVQKMHIAFGESAAAATGGDDGE